MTSSSCLLSVFLLVSLQFCVIFSSDLQFHHKLSKRDLRKIFHVDSPDEVPKYNIIELRSRSRRSAKGIQTKSIHIKAFGEEQTLNLTPNKALTRNVPVFFADTHEKGIGGVVLTPVPQNDDIGIAYQDEATRTAVVIKHHPDTGALLMDGTIGEEYVVRSVPSSLHSLVPASKSRGREVEASENDLLEDDLLEEHFQEEDLVFSDGLPLVAGDEFVTGSSVLPPEKPVGKQIKNNVTKESLPEGLLLLRKKRSTSQGLHIIYKREVPHTDTDYASMEPDQIPTRNPNARNRRKREAPYVIYPEILVLVDYDGYLLHGQDNSQIKSYYVSFWNGVDLRYKLLKGPRVKISIAGIIISRSKDAMPYLERNQVGRDAIDSAAALTDMGKYLYQERRLPTYDIAVAITKYDLCRRRQSGNCTTGTAGFAYVGGACVVNKRLEKVNSVAIVEDTGGFSGIIVAAHEVGHLLGAVHDGSPPPSYLGGPGARRCRWKDGYIMSDLRHTERGFMWSPCSVEQFHHFLNGETATCLYNLPHEDESLPRILPGKLLTLDAQCRKDRGTSACFKDDRVCAQLFCFDSSSGFCVSYRPAAEGSSCGSGKICLNGKCTFDNENSISDLDIHRPDDNFLHDSIHSNTVVAFETTKGGKTTTQSPTKTSTSTTMTTKPFTTQRSDWWKNNNRWNNNNIQSTTISYSRTTTPSPAMNQTPKQTTPKQTTIKRTTSTTKWLSTTTKQTTTPTTTTSTTTTTTPTKTTTTTAKPIYHNPITDSKDSKNLNSFNNNDSNSCEDHSPSIASNLSCKEFLKNYGFRYCNHRYIEKNCCKSKKELCSKYV